MIIHVEQKMFHVKHFKEVSKKMPNINVAYQWAVNACNAPNIGYSQQYRRGQTVIVDKFANSAIQGVLCDVRFFFHSGTLEMF